MQYNNIHTPVSAANNPLIASNNPLIFESLFYYHEPGQPCYCVAVALLVVPSRLVYRALPVPTYDESWSPWVDPVTYRQALVSLRTDLRAHSPYMNLITFPTLLSRPRPHIVATRMRRLFVPPWVRTSQDMESMVDDYLSYQYGAVCGGRAYVEDLDLYGSIPQ